MNPTSQREYDYETAGFDSFLSRSIDTLQQVNLDSPGPNSTQVRFDSSQLSGFVGDALSTPDVTINSTTGITVKHGMLNSFDEHGNQSIFNGAPYIKLLPFTLNLDVNALLNAGYVNLSFPHGLSTTPDVTGSVNVIDQGTNTWHPLPFLWRTNNTYFNKTDVFSASIVIDSVDNNYITCRVDIHDIAGYSFFLRVKKLSVIFYCRLIPKA